MDESSAANPSLAELTVAPQRTHIAERYRVLRVLGEGSSGTVYLCEHTALVKAVAVKVLHRELADNAGLVARFTREAQTAARLDHPNSVHVMDFGQDRDGMLYLAMEYVDGPDLAQLLAQNIPLDDARIVHFMTCILSALSAAHALGIVHRDLKPENVLVKLADPGSPAPDVVKVCDFGVAQLSPVRVVRSSGAIPISSETRRVTGEGMMVGTPWYMSPEQARAQASDARSDIYSAGVVLFQLLTRTLPFVGDDVMAVALMHCTTPPPPPSGYGAVHPGLEAVCLKALSKTPEARYQSATEMLTALREAVATQVASRSLARSSRTSLARVAPVSARPEIVSTTPLATPSLREQAPRKMKHSLLVAGVATTLLGVAAVPRFLPSQHAVVTTLSAAASRSASMLEQTFGSRGAPQPLAADAPIQDDPEIASPANDDLPLGATLESLPLAATELGLPDQTASSSNLPDRSRAAGARKLETPGAAPARGEGAKPASSPRAGALPVASAQGAASESSSSVGTPAGAQRVTATLSANTTAPATSLLSAATTTASFGRPTDATDRPAVAPASAGLGRSTSGAGAPLTAAGATSSPSPGSDLLLATAVLPVSSRSAEGKPATQQAPAGLQAPPRSPASAELDGLPESASEAAASAAAIALSTLPAPGAKPAVQPTAAKPAAPLTKPLTFRRVEIAADHLPPGTSRASLRGALSHVSLLGCYTQAQQRMPTAELTGTAVELRTNTSGRVVSAHATNSALPQPLRDCLEQVARSGNIRTGEGGEVRVTVQLLPSL